MCDGEKIAKLNLLGLQRIVCPRTYNPAKDFGRFLTETVSSILSSSFRNWSFGKASKYPGRREVSMFEPRLRTSSSKIEKLSSVGVNGIKVSIMLRLRSRL